MFNKQLCLLCYVSGFVLKLQKNYAHRRTDDGLCYTHKTAKEPTQELRKVTKKLDLHMMVNLHKHTDKNYQVVKDL